MGPNFSNLGVVQDILKRLRLSKLHVFYHIHLSCDDCQVFLDFFYDLAHGDVEDEVRAHCYSCEVWSYFFLDLPHGDVEDEVRVLCYSCDVWSYF